MCSNFQCWVIITNHRCCWCFSKVLYNWTFVCIGGHRYMDDDYICVFSMTDFHFMSFILCQLGWSLLAHNQFLSAWHLYALNELDCVCSFFIIMGKSNSKCLAFGFFFVLGGGILVFTGILADLVCLFLFLIFCGHMERMPSHSTGI